MIEQQRSKRPRSRISKAHLSNEQRRAFETVAALMNKPLSTFYEEEEASDGMDDNLVGAQPIGNAASAQESHPVSVASTDPPSMWQEEVDIINSNDSAQATAWTNQLETVFREDDDMFTPFASQGSAGTYQLDQITQEDNYIPLGWSHMPTADQSWLSVPTSFINVVGCDDHQGEEDGDTRKTVEVSAQSSLSTSSMQPSSQITRYASNSGMVPSDPEFLGTKAIDEDWVKVQRQNSTYSDQLALSTSLAKSPDSDQRFPFNNSTSQSDGWTTLHASARHGSMKDVQRRGPFKDEQLRAETSMTRKNKACVRCRMQKCQINTIDPTGICQTCQEVTTQRIHTLPCMRGKLTECVLFRIGKAPGLEFTFRWPVMKLKDISEWSESKIRTIKVMSDICPEPLELSVRRFVPHPEKDRLKKSWMDGKVKKYKTTTPFAIVNMTATKEYMKGYINEHIFKCMDYWLKDRDDLIKQTFNYARKYMTKAPEEEQGLLADYFRLWFASRRTATTEWIVGDDTLDMQPEMTDTSYPLCGKGVPLPPVMIQQLDMILTLGFLIPLRKGFLEKFNKIVLRNSPKSWMTIYLITFMSLQSCAAFTKEQYENARKHGLARRFAMPSFIEDRHHSSNVFLYHYHYCTKPCNPFKVDWRKRHTTPFAEMTTDDIDFLLMTNEVVVERKDKFRRTLRETLYEDDFYFVAQLFEDEWTMRETVVEYSDETINGGSLQEIGSPPRDVHA